MEDSFSVRVDKIFGSLGGGHDSSSAAISPSLWSLTDEEVERRQWNRSKEVGKEGGGDDVAEFGKPSDWSHQLESDLEDMSDFEHEEEENEVVLEEIDGGKTKRGSSSNSGTSFNEDWDVQSNIGRDCTLDYEEEEDEYDKVAVGKEKSGDRLYMRDVKHSDYGMDEVNTYGELPISFGSVARDPRANHSAAKIRLKEDAEASQNFDNLHLSDDSVARSALTTDLEKVESDGDNPKPILKKRESVMDSRSQKRVRFSFETKSCSDNEEQGSSKPGNSASEPCAGNDSAVHEQISDLSQYSSGVPDYVKNPSKYTHYTFESTDEDMDDRANQKAYLDFLECMGKNDPVDSSNDDGISDANLTSVTFTLKKKPEGHSNTKIGESNCSNKRENLKSSFCCIGIDDDGVSRMEEDGPCIGVDEGGGLLKPGRQVKQYRSRMKANADEEENLTPT